MILNLLMVAGGLLALVVWAVVARAKRLRPTGSRIDYVSGDWLGQARAREEHPW